MVVIKNYSGTQIDNLPDVTGRVLYDSTLNALRFHNSTNFGNIIAHKDASNNMSGVNNFRTTGNLGINTSAPDKQVEINSSTGDCLRLTYNDNNGSASNYTDLLVSSSGDLTLTASGGNVNISSHNGSTTGLQLNGTLVTATAAQLNYNVVTPGTASASKALILDSSRNITNINALTATNLTGTLQTAAQTNITSVGTLAGLVATGIVNVSSHDGSTTGLQLNGTLVTATAAQLNYNNVTPGTVSATKAMVVDSSRNIGNLNNLRTTGNVGINTSAPDKQVEINSSTGDCLRLTYNDSDGTAATYFDNTVSSAGVVTMTANGSAPSILLNNATNVSSTLNVTGAVGVGTSAPNKKLEINSSTGDCLRLTYDDSDGSAANYTDLLITSSGDLNITPSGGDVNLTSHNGSTTGLKLNGTLVTSTATKLNYTDISTLGFAEASKALVLDASRNIVNLNYVEVSNLVAVKTGTGDNTIDFPISLITLPVNEASIGLGTGIEFNSVNDADSIYNAGYINYVSSNITDGTESGFFDFKLANGGTIDSICTISNNGVVSATSYVETSDLRSKENIQETISVDSLAKILQVHVKTYNYKKDLDKRSHIGVIAQEIKKIVPESVVISKTDDFDDFHQVSYTSLIPHLINCIKVLHEELEELKSKI
jgi:hypothetical protein